jgi:hypothetical protein
LKKISLVNKQNECLFNNRISKLEGGEGTILSGGFFFQKLFEGLYKDTLGVLRPAVFPPAVTRFFFSVLFCLMILTGQTIFDNH